MNKSMKQAILFLFLAFLGINSFAQEVTGKWISIDDNTGTPRSEVEIYLEDGKLFGRIIKLYNDDPTYNPVCEKCKGDLKNKPIIGMQIINGLTQKSGKWESDKGILDPESGKIYDVKIWVEGDQLKIRGYIGILYRTQTWERA